MPLPIASRGPKLRILWTIYSVGPYHHARFNALADESTIDLIVAEVASTQERYPWTRSAAKKYALKTLFPKAIVENLNAARVAARMIRAFNETDPDVCIVTGYGSLWPKAVAVWAKCRKKLCITTFVSTEIDRPRKKPIELTKSVLLRSLFDGVSCAGSRSKAYLLKLGVTEERIGVCGNVVDNNHFARRREPRTRGLPPEFILAVTRFSPEKNLPFLLRAYERYAARAEACKTQAKPLVLCGSGPMEQQIRAQAEGIRNGKVMFPGFLGYDELPEVYQRAVCVTLPSLSEPWGLVVNEACAAGVPVLVSDRCGCSPELVKPGKNGFLFSPTQLEQLGALIEQTATMSDEERHDMGREGQKLVAQFTLASWTQAFLDLLSRCATKKPRLGHATSWAQGRQSQTARS